MPSRRRNIKPRLAVLAVVALLAAALDGWRAYTDRIETARRIDAMDSDVAAAQAAAARAKASAAEAKAAAQGARNVLPGSS